MRDAVYSEDESFGANAAETPVGAPDATAVIVDGMPTMLPSERKPAESTTTHATTTHAATTTTSGESPVAGPRLVSATTFATPPAEGIPVSGRPGQGATFVTTPSGVFAFSGALWDDPLTRETMEREFARELGDEEGAFALDLEQFVMARQLSKIVRLFALIDVVMCVLYALSGADYIAILLFGPLGGFIGARMYNPSLTCWYLLFCCLGIAWRVSDFILVKEVTPRILALVTFVLSVYITRLVARFWSLIRLMSREVQTLLRQLDYAHTSPVI